MSTAAEPRPLEPGLHVRTDAEPVERAKALAAELDADLCVTAHEAEVLLAKLTALPALPADALPVLGELTGRLVAAQRIADRTLDRAALQVGERLAAVGSGMAIHPSSVRDRAAAVITARAALAVAEEELRVREVAAATAADDPTPASTPPAGPSAEASRVEVLPAPRRRRFFDFFRRRGDRRVEDTSESTSLLQLMAASTDEAFGARRAEAARDDQLVVLGAQRIRAHEELRVAERAWADLAGDDAVEDVEAVVRRFDPQHQNAVEVARETVGVRAVMTLLERARERWEEAWRSFGFEPPPSADEDAMASMSVRLTRTVVIVDAAVDKAELLALAAPAAAVVAVEPAS